MDYKAVYDYCSKLMHRAITDAYSRLDAGDAGGFRNLMALAGEALTMTRDCMLAVEVNTRSESVH